MLLMSAASRNYLSVAMAGAVYRGVWSPATSCVCVVHRARAAPARRLPPRRRAVGAPARQHAAALRQSVAPASIARRLSCLSSFYGYGVEVDAMRDARRHGRVVDKLVRSHTDDLRLFEAPLHVTVFLGPSIEGGGDA